MSVLVTDIEPLIRKIIADNLVKVTDVFEYTTSDVFTLEQDYPYSILEVLVAGTESGVTYTFDSDTNKLTITSPLVSLDLVEITYDCYLKYSAVEISNYIEVALMELANRNFQYYTVVSGGLIYPEPDKKEQYLIAAVTAILMEPNNNNISTRDLTIKVPNGNVSTSKLIDKIVAGYKHNTHGIFNT
jgi:hypothetical protein